MSDNITGWEREKRIHFDEIVVNYDKARPTFPDELIGDVLKFTRPVHGQLALEIGAGTGKATTPFLNAGYDVTAVEIGSNMADFLRDKFGGYPNFNVIVSAFEDVVLEVNRYDLVYAATSFHWIDAAIGCPKVFRLLKHGGTFALFRYNYAVDTGDKRLHEEIRAVYEKHYFTYYTGKSWQSDEGKSKEQRKAELKEPRCMTENYGFADMSAYGFTDVTIGQYDVSRTFDADEYIEYIDTMSDNRSLPDANRSAFYAGIRNAIIKYGEYYTEDLIFQLYMGRKM